MVGARVSQDQGLWEFLAGGVAAIVASRDAELRPTIARAWAPRPLDAERLQLCVAAPPGSRMRANLEANGAVAATFSLPTTYRTVQLKGTLVELRECNDEELAAVADHLAAFTREAERVGLPPAGGRRMLDPGLVTAVVDVRECYDQTPGPNAGARL